MIKLGRDCRTDQSVIADLTNLKPIVLVFPNIQIHIHDSWNQKSEGSESEWKPLTT
jgi:hypothetical protein